MLASCSTHCCSGLLQVSTGHTQYSSSHTGDMLAGDGSPSLPSLVNISKNSGSRGIAGKLGQMERQMLNIRHVALMALPPDATHILCWFSRRAHTLPCLPVRRGPSLLKCWSPLHRTLHDSIIIHFSLYPTHYGQGKLALKLSLPTLYVGMARTLLGCHT